MKIQDVEIRTGLDRATIRFYEKEGIVVPEREDNGYRSYSDEDVTLLLKIKLLRQLGLSLFNIKNLQQGSGDFSVILSRQVELLSKQIQNDNAAKQVCITMQQENAQYESLDSVRYLEMFSLKNTITEPSFQESVQHERHPWRRYFARMIDHAFMGAVCIFLFAVVFRIRPLLPNTIRTLNYLSNYFAIPIMALLLCFFGTTPGKWVMGIRLEHINGGNLTFREAFKRELSVFFFGEGLDIPVISLWRLIKSYKNDTEGYGNPWNEETEIIYTDWTYTKKAAIGLLTAGSLVLSVTSSLDTTLPKYRGNSITLKEFVRNYHDYEKLFDMQSEYVLTGEGNWTKKPENPYNVYVSSEPDHIRSNFTYEFDTEGYLTAVNYSDNWNDAELNSPVPVYCATAMYALLGSRPGCSYQDLINAEEMLVSEINKRLAEATKQGTFCGEFLINDINVSWCIDAKNCECIRWGIHDFDGRKRDAVFS